MPWFFTLRGNSSGNNAEVNAAGELKTALSALAGDAGFAKLLDSNGDPINTTEHGYLNVSTDDMVFFEQVDGAALNTNKWTTSVSTMGIVQAGGYISLNNAGVLSGYAILQSIRSIPMYSYLPLKISFNVLSTVLPQPNAIMEIGIGSVSGSSAPTDGAFFRWNALSEFRAVVNNNGSETQSSVLTPPIASDATLLDIVLVEDKVQFLVDDNKVAEIDVPVALAFPTNAGRLPLFARVYVPSGTPAQAPKLNIGQVVVAQQGLSQNKPWGDTLASLGLGAYQLPVTTFGQNANHANSTSPTSASLSNTAAGYATLGGRFQFAAPAGAVTDFALFAFQVPSGYQLYLQNIAISTLNLGAAVATTATVLDWALGVNGSVVSLATAESPPTSWAPRRIPIGMQSFLVGDGIGKQANDLERVFTTPIVVDGGRFLHVIVQIPVGTATGSQIIRGDVVLNGYFE